MQPRKRGRPKLSDWERLMRRREHSRKTSRAKVHIGIAIDRWNELRDSKGFEGNTQFALYLLDLAEREFKKTQDVKRTNALASSTLFASTPTLVGQLKADTPMLGGFGIDDENTCTGSEGEIDVVALSDVEMGSTSPKWRMIKVEKGTSDEYQITPTTSQKGDAAEQVDAHWNREPEDFHTLREPENLQMDCETVHENNLHEDTEMHRTRCSLTAVAPRNNRLMSSDHVLSIHGLPVNQPFSLKYSSPTAGSMVESKVYVIVEQHFVPNIKATPIKIDVKGRVNQISVAPNDSQVLRNQEENEMSDLVDTSHLKQSLELFKPHSDSPQGMPGIGEQPEGFEYVTVKVEWDENEKYVIISDILNDLIDKVVSKGDIQRNHGFSNSKRKNKHQTMCNITKKQRILKYEDKIDGELPHSSRSRSRGFRINYADLDKLGGLSDVSDLEDIFSESDESDDADRVINDNKIPGDEECEVTDNSMQKRSKVGKKMEDDPDFNLENFFMTGSDKKKFNMCELDTEISSSDSYIDSACNIATDGCSTAEKEILDKAKVTAKKLQNRLQEERTRIKVFLKDHPDKYFTETQVSAERKFRGLKEADKTFKLLVCALCKQFRTSNTVLLETHLEHHLNGDWKCKKCKFEGNTFQEYRLHISEKHPSGRKRCLVCKKRCGWKKQLHEHLAKAHNLLPYICTRCSTDKSYVMFKEKSEYHQHYLEKHKDVMLQCTFCGLYFLNSAARRSHTCSGKESEMATCDICGKEMRRVSLKHHQKWVHDNVRPFPCHLCSYAAQKANALRFHLSAKHGGVHQVKCEICDFTCVRKYQLVSHMRTHTGDKPYKCDLCPYSAAWNVQLKEHKRLHGNPMGKECDVCGIVVRKGVSYSNHYKKHNGGTS